MPVIQIAQYNHAAIGPGVLTAVKSASESSADYKFQAVIGNVTKDPQTVQITSKVTSSSEIGDSTLRSLRQSLGTEQLSYRADLKDEIFDESGAATFKVVEYVLSYFPASKLTADFRGSIEKTFEEFDDMYKKGAVGGQTWTLGWVENGITHNEILDEPVKGFLVVRGWDNMEEFEASVQTEEFRQAFPLLQAWNAPFKMWHVERKALL